MARKFRTFSVTAGVAALIAAGGLALAADASAHSAALSGAAVCGSNGTYTITWTGTTDNVPDGQVATVTETAPDQKVLTTTLAANAGFTTTTTAPGTATAAHAAVHIAWFDGGQLSFETDAEADLSLAGNCSTTPPTTTPVTAVPPSATPPSCTAAGTLVIPTQPKGVRLTGGSNGAGPGTYHLVVQYNHKRFTLNGPSSFDVTVLPRLTGSSCSSTPPPGSVTAVPPSATPPTCTTAGTLVIPTEPKGVRLIGATNGAGPGTYHLVVRWNSARFTLNGPSSFDVTVLPKLTGSPCSESTPPSSGSSTPSAPCSTCTSGSSSTQPVVLADGSPIAQVSTGGSDGGLASTGSDTGAEITIALAALALGGFTLLLGRRRQH